MFLSSSITLSNLCILLFSDELFVSPFHCFCFCAPSVEFVYYSCKEVPILIPFNLQFVFLQHGLYVISDGIFIVLP